MTTRTIKVNYLARVEGEGALLVKLRRGRVEDVQLRIFEAPRFFEALLRGRGYDEAPDLTARICGICPVAYQMSAVHAIERAFGVEVGGALRDLRRLLYCGEWIESHALHLYMLHAPDFLGAPDALTLAKTQPGVVERGLALKKAGNQILRCLGGREVHPINVRVGGFYRTPRRDELRALRPELEAALGLAEATVRWVAGFTFPECERDVELVALCHESEYPMNEGRLKSTRGLDIRPEEFAEHFEEIQVPYSNALHCVRKGAGSYLTGPLARFALNRERLAPAAQASARAAGLTGPVLNPFRSIVVRAVEVVHACAEALRIIDAYEPPVDPSLPVTPVAGEGCAATEAPRGTLWHRYRIGDDGRIAAAQIVAPTSQNQRSIEDDLRAWVPARIDLPRAELTRFCERAIRNHDPCISCATHFLRLDVEELP